MKQHFISNQSGTRLCLHYLPAHGDAVAAVVLAHGMFSNYRACRGLAQYLARLNFDCWLLDYQAHGHSDKSSTPVDFETLCLHDTEATLKFLQTQTNPPLWWVGHSGGGLAIAMYLARYPERQGSLAGFVTLASQATDAGLKQSRRVQFRLFRALIRVLGKAPGKSFGLGPEDESVAVMDQWLRWSLSRRWTGADGFDYSDNLGVITVPSLSLAAIADRFIAPVSGCRKMHSLLGGDDKTFVVFGKVHGHLEDYTHARLISSRKASVDVWPLVGQWIVDRLPADQSQ